MAKEFAFDVFLSYSSKDKPRVLRIAEKLKAAGLRVWLDQWTIAPGEDIYLAIEGGLETSRTQLLFLSSSALGSDWVRLERSTALFRDPTNKERRFVPVLLEDCELPDALRRFRYIDLRSDSEAAFAELLAASRAVAPEAPPTAPGKTSSRGRAGRFALFSLGASLAGLLLVWFLTARVGLSGLVPSPEPFAVTVFVHGPNGVQDIPLRNTGFVVLDLGPDRRREAIGEKGQAYFVGIPASFRGEMARVWVEADGYAPVTPVAPQSLSETSLYLAVGRQGATLRGRVQDQEGQPIGGANVRVRDLSVSTGPNGAFALQIPGDIVQQDLYLEVSAKGYTPWRELAVPESNEVVVVLRRPVP